jgi:phosphatidylinositol glycan class M
MTNRFRIAVALAIVLRGVLIIYGAYQDARSILKYTDIDYRVFSDAARIMLHPTRGQHAKGWLVEWLDWDIGEFSNGILDALRGCC